MVKSEEYILGLDISTKCIGVVLFKDNGDCGHLTLLTHVSPKVKPEPNSKLEELFEKARIFESEFLNKYIDIGIKRVIIEEPLLQSNNVYTVATLLRFNGMIARAVYEKLGIVPEFISSYDARKYAFPELMSVRTVKKDGKLRTKKEIEKSEPVLFGGYAYDVDKKMIIWEKVAKLESQIVWFYDKNNKLKKESFDMTDAYTATIGWMQKENLWKQKIV